MSWDEEFNEALEASPAIVREAYDAQIDQWNGLLFELSKIAKDGAPYEGEADDELLVLLRERCAPARRRGRTFNGGTRVSLGFALNRDRLWVHVGRWTYWVDV
jgi:hypothetical protein